MKTLVARSAAGALVAAVAGIIMLYAPTLGGDDTGPDPDAAFLAAEKLDPDSAFFRGDYETAAALYRVMALAGRERPPGRHAELGVVRSLIAMGRFDEAEHYIRRLDTDSTRTLTRTDADLLICLRSEIYTRTAEIPLALEYANDCRQRVRPETGVDAAATWYAFYVTAFSHAEADRFDAAIGHYRDALRVLERAGLDRSPEYAQTVNHLANIHYRTGAFTRSRRLHEQALHMRLSLFPESHPAIAASFGNIGNVLHAMGDFESALTHHRRALSIWNGSLGPAHPQTAYSLNNIGFALNRLGRFEEAEYFLLRSEDVKSRVLSGGSLSIARTHRNLADAYLGQGNTHLARRYADRALTAVNESGHQMDILAAQALVSLAGILRAENRTTEAEAALIDAQRRAFEQNHPYAVVAMNQLARAHLADARSRDALAVTQRAILFGTGSGGQASSGGAVLDAARSPVRTSQLVLADSYGIRASAHLDLYRTTAEHERLEAALSSIHRAMGVLGYSPLIRTDLTMSSHLTDRLEDLATTGLEIAVEAWKCGCGGDPIRDALTFSDILKNGFEYTERLIAEGPSDGPSGHDQHGLDDLRLQLFEARRRRAVLDLQFASTPRRVQDLESRIFEIERRIRDARRSIRLERSPGIVEMFDPGPAGLYDLPADLLVADYVLLEDRIVAISLTRSGGSIHEIARSPRLDALLKTYPDIVRNAGATLFARNARALHRHLLDPLEIGAGIRRLLISPHEMLWDIPFETLLTRNFEQSDSRGPVLYADLPYLVIERAVSYTRSGGARSNGLLGDGKHDSPESTFHTTNRGLLAAAPGFDYDHSLSDPVRDFLSLHGYSHLEADRQTAIGGSVREVLQLTQPGNRTSIFDRVDVFTDADATETTIKRRLSFPYNIIHIATHGYSSSAHPIFSGILLSQETSTNNDGILYANELHNIPIDTRLMVISACYSGYSNGGEVAEAKFIHALSTPDIHNVLLSLWPLMDADASDIISDFYSYIYNLYSVESALRHAKIQAINGSPVTSHPAAWAPFIHLSNSRYGAPVL